MSSSLPLFSPSNPAPSPSTFLNLLSQAPSSASPSLLAPITPFPSNPPITPFGSLPGITPFPRDVPAPQRAGSVVAPTSVRSEIDLEDVLRAMDEAEGMVKRSDQVYRQIREEEGMIFQGEEREASTEDQSGRVLRIQTLHEEYETLLRSLITLATTHLFGALPLDPTLLVAKSTDGDMHMNGESWPTMDQVTEWVEESAARDFERREAMKEGRKGVLDILRKGMGG